MRNGATAAFAVLKQYSRRDNNAIRKVSVVRGWQWKKLELVSNRKSSPQTEADGETRDSTKEEGEATIKARYAQKQKKKCAEIEKE